MKFPKSFRPEKDLEEKMNQLVNSANPMSKSKRVHLDRLKHMASKIAVETGKLIDRDKQGMRDRYTYFYEQDEFFIEYFVEINVLHWDATDFLINVIYDDNTMYLEDKQGLDEYTPGIWEERLLQIYENEISEEL